MLNIPNILKEDTVIKSPPALSAEVFVIPLEDEKYIIYAPLRRAAFIGNSAVVNFLAELQEGKIDKSLDPDGLLVEFFRRLEFLGADPATLPIKTFSGSPEPTSITLFLTTACNLRCTYCYASAGDTPLKSMSLDTAKRGIDFIISNAVKKGEMKIDIAYHGGGEPTVNWRVITESLGYARRKASEVGLLVTAASASNGVLRDEQIDWIIENLHGVSLSFDGLPEIHDKHRLTVLGTGSSHRVIHTMRRLDAACFKYGVRLTVTEDHIHCLPDSIDFICANFRPHRIQVEPAYKLGRWSSSASAETKEFIAAYRVAQVRAAKYGYEIYYSAARLDTLTNHFCGISRDTFALSPDGNVSACYEVFSEDNPLADVFFYGEPNEKSGKYKFNLPVLNNLRDQGVQHRSYCRGCFAKWHCAGDCYHKALNVNGIGEFSGTDRCHITRELIKDQILTRISEAVGLFWHELPERINTGDRKIS